MNRSTSNRRTAFMNMARIATAVVLGLSLTHAAHAVIVTNGVSGRFIRINKTKPNNLDAPFHIGEVRGLLLGKDFANSSQGATATSVHGSFVHGAVSNIISNSQSVAGATWTRDDANTGPGVFEVEALIDLGQTRSLSEIQVLQRQDCCGSRLFDFSITLEDATNTPVASSGVFGGTAPNLTSFTLASGQTILPGGDGVIGADQVGRNARFIRLQNNGGAYRSLHTSEIEGFAPGVVPDNNSAPSTNDITGTSFESQQGVGGHGSTSAVFDGNLETVGDTWTREGAETYYTLDLGSTQDVETVRAWQRGGGCCPGRLSNFTVSLLSDDGSGSPGGLLASQSFGGTASLFEGFTFADAFTIGADDTLKIDLDAAANTSDLLLTGAGGLGALTIVSGATLDVSNLAGALSSDQTFNILDFGSISGEFSTVILPEGRWDTSNLYTTGEIIFKTIPEPSTALLAMFGFGCAALLRRSRRGRTAVLALVLVIGSQSSIQAANLIVNGDFSGGTSGTFAPGAAMGGSNTVPTSWIGFDTSDSSLNGSGGNVIFNGANKPAGSWVQQTIALSPNKWYTLEWDHEDGPGITPSNAVSTAEIWSGTTTVGSPDLGDRAVRDTTLNIPHVLKTSSSNITVRLGDTGSNTTSNDTQIDNVSLDLANGLVNIAPALGTANASPAHSSFGVDPQQAVDGSANFSDGRTNYHSASGGAVFWELTFDDPIAQLTRIEVQARSGFNSRNGDFFDFIDPLGGIIATLDITDQSLWSADGSWLDVAKIRVRNDVSTSSPLNLAEVRAFALFENGVLLAPIPEPSTIILAAFGLMSLGLRRRRGVRE